MRHIYEEVKWKKSTADNFWNEIAPCDHVIQIYKDNDIFIEMLARFVLGGIQAKKGVVLIATPARRLAIERRLKEMKIPIIPNSNQHYFPIDAETMLSSILVDDKPDEVLFVKAISSLLKQVRQANRRVWVFSEMVAILWQQGNYNGTYQLESLWNNYCEKDVFGILHSYPFSSFTENNEEVMKKIWSLHSKIIAPTTSKPIINLLYARL